MTLFEVIGNGELGGKGEWTKKAIEAGLKFPDTFIISTEVFDSTKFVWDDEGFLTEESGLSDDFDSELERMFEYFHGKPIAVRSSVTVEDSYSATCAGMFPTHFMNPASPNALDYFKRAVLFMSLFCSVFGDDQKVYVKKHNLPMPKMAVEVQNIVGSRVKPISSRFPKGGLAPRLAGYFNTMYPDRFILGIVNGLGTAAVTGRENPVFHFSPEGDLIDFMDKQKRFDLFCYWTTCLKSVITESMDPRFFILGRDKEQGELDLTISHDDARAAFKTLVETERTSRKEFQISPEYGLDIEWAVERDLSDVTYLQMRPVKRKQVKILFPDVPSMIETYSIVGVGRKDITQVVDISKNCDWHRRANFDKLKRFNKHNKGYLLIVPRGTFYSSGDISQTNVPYSAFYNAGLILTPEREGTYATGADHFALICNDDDILYMDAELKPGNPLGLQENMDYSDDELDKLYVHNKELTAIVDANRGKAVLFENPGFKI